MKACHSRALAAQAGFQRLALRPTSGSPGFEQAGVARHWRIPTEWFAAASGRTLDPQQLPAGCRPGGTSAARSAASPGLSVRPRPPLVGSYEGRGLGRLLKEP